MRLLIKDQFRKIKKNLFNFLSLSFLVLVISLTYTTVVTSITRLDQNHEEYLQEQKIEDFYFVMGEFDMSNLSEAAIYTVCDEYKIRFECAYAYVLDTPESLNNLNIIINEEIKKDPTTYQSLIESYIDDFKKEYNFEIEKSYILDIKDNDHFYKFSNITEEINIPYIVEGTLPVKVNEVMIYPDYADANNLEIGDTLTIQDIDYTITGFMYKPEFLFPIMSMEQIEFDKNTQTMVVTTQETMDNFNQYLFTKYLVRGDLSQLEEDFGYETIQSGDFSFLGKNMQSIYILMPRDINFRIITLGLEIENAQAFINIFLPVFVGLVSLLLIIFMRRYVKENDKDIYTLHALGYTKREISLSILIYPFLISLFSILGYVIGIVLSNQTFDLYSNRYHFPKAEAFFSLDILLIAVVFPIILITLLNFLFIYLEINRKPKEKKIKLPIFKFTPFKTVLQTFVLFLTISIMITFGLNGNSMFSAFVDHTKMGNNFELMANLQFMTNDPVLDTYETYTRSPVIITQVNSQPLKNSQTSTVYGIKTDTTLKILINNEPSSNLLLEDGVVISDYLLSTLNLKVGDTITFTVGQKESTETIMGVSNELIENNFFIEQSKLNSFYDLDESYYNGLYLTDSDYTSPYLTTTINYKNSLDEFASILNISSIIINFLVVLSVIISIFMFVLIILNYYRDIRLQVSILKSIGYNNIEINKKYLLSLYIVFLLSYTLAVPITNTLLKEMLDLLMETIGYKLILDISILNIFIGFIIINSLFIIVTIFTNKYYDRIQISDIMKTNIK